jgi:Xaa-Pro dipeptidase
MATDSFSDHLETVAGRWEAALAAAGFDVALVTAGEPRNHFLDDHAPPLKLNPHFMQWCPAETAQGSALLIRPGSSARLFFLQPDDYWHLPPALPEWAEHFEVEVFADRDQLLRAAGSQALTTGNRVAVVGDSGVDQLDGVPEEDVNPAELLARLHYDRAVKTPFELEAMRAATRTAVRGHLAARDAFEAGGSEFRIHSAYLSASEQTFSELPYSSIVALNEHAGVLHYQHYDRVVPDPVLSFLIDAGASCHGYAADITRTYARTPSGPFAELVERLDTAQQELIDSMQPGMPYLDLHADMHRRLAGVLTDAGLATGSPEAVFDSGLTETFLPHGLGHLLGLQVHDVGGLQADAVGTEQPPPENYPALRLTRRLEANMPVTIEPGLYFIPQLLAAARTTSAGGLVNWPLVDSLLPYGGIRIEDNVMITADGVENMTRQAFADLAETGS